MGLVVDIADGAVVKERQYRQHDDARRNRRDRGSDAAADGRPTIGAPTIAVSTGSDVERANVETFRTNMAAFNAHDVKTLARMNAPDAVFHDYTQAKDMDGAGNAAVLAQLFKGFPDAKLEAATSWGAGDYVVTEGTFSGTNKAAVPLMGIAKATGKSAAVRFIEVTKVENGKIKEDWLVFDSMAFATQLGL